MSLSYSDLRRAGLSQSLAVVNGKISGKNGQFWQLEGSDLIAALTLQNREVASTETQSTTSPQMNDLPRLPICSTACPTVIMSRSLAAKVAPTVNLF